MLTKNPEGDVDLSVISPTGSFKSITFFNPEIIESIRLSSSFNLSIKLSCKFKVLAASISFSLAAFKVSLLESMLSEAFFKDSSF